jgi:PPOX class probable F420-dependent enzyme
MTPEEQRRLVEGARVARLATLESDGRPHVVPICFAIAGDTLYSAVDWKPKRSTRLRRIENARARPQVTVLVDEYDEDWSRLWWVRLRGAARVLDDGSERDRALALLESRYQQYRERPPHGPVLALDVHDWYGWAAAEDSGAEPVASNTIRARRATRARRRRSE